MNTAAAQAEYKRLLKLTQKAINAWNVAREALRAAESGTPDAYRAAFEAERAAHAVYEAASAKSGAAYKILSACWAADYAAR